MNLTNIGSNQIEVTVNGCVVLFSYNTPVAAFVSAVNNFGLNPGWYKTNKKWSMTTSKHINKWWAGEYIEKEQQFFQNLISG